MPANNRSIRDTLDAYSTVDASTNTGIATRMVDAITNYYQNVFLSGNFYGLFYYIGVHKMDDNNTNFHFTLFGNDHRNYFNLVSGHGIDISNPASTNNNYGRLDGYGAYNNLNQGLKHYNDSVQFGKGISSGTAPGISNTANSGYISGTSLNAVIEGNNAYRTINIKMSDFRGLTKTDPVNNNYIYNSGDGTEEIYTTGPISVGNGAINSL